MSEASKDSLGSDLDDADFLEICDLCGDFHDLQQIRLDCNGYSFYCDKCGN